MNNLSDENFQFRKKIVDELHKGVRRTFKRRKVIIRGLENINLSFLFCKVRLLFRFDETWSIDLIEFIPFADENRQEIYIYCKYFKIKHIIVFFVLNVSGYNKYILCCIDNFSKMGFVRPLKDKKSITITNAMEDIFVKSGRVPEKIHHDAGGWMNFIVKEVIN